MFLELRILLIEFMRILQLCKKFPYPLKDGESIAVSSLSKAFHDFGCEVTLLSMNTTKHYTDISKLPADYNHYKEIHVTELDNRVKVWDAIRNLFSTKSFHVSRFESKEYEAKLISLLQSNVYDIIQLETLYLTPYMDTIRKYSDAIITMRSHNVEHEIWERITQNTKLLPKKIYLDYLTKKLKNFELETLNEYDYLISVTDRDLKKFKQMGYKNGAMASPIGLQMDRYKGVTPKLKGKDISFIGSMDWRPNVEGLIWFLDKVWPSIHEAHPNVKFHIAGRNTPADISRLDLPNVVIHGEVECALSFLQSSPITVVPLFSGSGMRVKILEGLALGRVVVSTTLGKEGIEANNGQEILVADTADQFIEHINQCLDNMDQMNNISKSAMSLAHSKYDHMHNARKLLDKYQSLIDSGEYN